MCFRKSINYNCPQTFLKNYGTLKYYVGLFDSLLNAKSLCEVFHKVVVTLTNSHYGEDGGSRTEGRELLFWSRPRKFLYPFQLSLSLSLKSHGRKGGREMVGLTCLLLHVS